MDIVAAASAKAKPMIVRANALQTKALKSAFAKSNVAAPDDLKVLSERTGLYACYNPVSG